MADSSKAAVELGETDAENRMKWAAILAGIDKKQRRYRWKRALRDALEQIDRAMEMMEEVKEDIADLRVGIKALAERKRI